MDDEHDALEALRGILLAAGFEVDCASSIAAARGALIAAPPDLLVTDLYVGDSGLGFELAEVARTCKPPVPVVVLTGRPSFGGAQGAVRAHVTEIVAKPVDPASFVAVCEHAIEEAAIRRRARLLEAQNRVLAGVVPRIIDAKDPTTSGHSNRVIRYSDRLAERCGVSDADRESLRLAALLHDIGKVGIPRTILCKEGPLTPDERAVIETHPAMGFEMLEPLEGMDDVRNWVYQHHERWDGRGYPNGLRGEEVALPGRILVLAEVYDALAEARSYKAAWTVERIVAHFREHAGTHFDPDVAHLTADGLEREGRRFFAAHADLLF